MTWTLFSSTPPVVGQGAGPLDLIICLWPATLISAARVEVWTIAKALALTGQGIVPSYWLALPAFPASTADTSIAAQIAVAQAVQAQLAAQGNDTTVLTAAIATLQNANKP